MQLFEIPIKSNYLPPCISGELYLMVIAFQPLFYVIIIMLSKGLIYPVLIPRVIQLVQLHKWNVNLEYKSFMVKKNIVYFIPHMFKKFVIFLFVVVGN